MTKPTVITTRKPLPFGELSPSEFERLCLWLVDLEGYLRPQHLGEAGGEQGRDVIAYKRTESGEELTYFQCKRYKKISATTLKIEVDKYTKLIESDPTKRPAAIVFVTNAAVSARVRDQLEKYCRERHFACDFWARTELDMLVKKHSKIVEEFFDAARPRLTTTPNQLRAPVPDFVGRQEEIGMLIKTLRAGGRASISSIIGMGGIGKTELALLVANRLRDAYPDAQIFINMRGTDKKPLDSAEALAACIRAFAGLETKLPDDIDELTRLYLASLNDKRALVVLDNAFSDEHVRPLLPPEGCALLVTSRSAIALPGVARIALDQLKPDEARGLLLGSAPRVTPEIADLICELCGYLPLAIRAAGSLLAVTVDLDAADYAAQLRDERTRLERIGTEGVDVGVEASFNLSYARLQPKAARVFCSLAVFSGSFDARAEETVCNDTNHAFLSNLVKRSLVLFDSRSRRYRLHDLMRLFALKRLISEENGAALRHALHYLALAGIARTLYEEGGEALERGLALFDQEWSNIRAGQAWAENHAGEDDVAAALCMRYPDAALNVLELRQHPRERILWRNAALASARHLKNEEAEGFHLSNLGLAYLQLGETGRAIEYHRKSLAIKRKLGDRRGEGIVLGNLANAYLHFGKARRAIEYNQQCLTIARETGNDRSERYALGNLGMAHAALGDTQRAIEFHEQDLLMEREFGDRLGESKALHNLASCYDLKGESQRAIELYEQAKAIAHEIGYRGGEGTALWNISRALKELGDRTKAIAYAEKAVEILEEISDPDAAGVREVLAAWHGEQ